MRIAVLQSSSKSYFQDNLAINITRFWARPNKITPPLVKFTWSKMKEMSFSE